MIKENFGIDSPAQGFLDILFQMHVPFKQFVTGFTLYALTCGWKRSINLWGGGKQTQLHYQETESWS